MNKDTVIIMLIAAIVALVVWLIVIIDSKPKTPRCSCDMFTANPMKLDTRQAHKFQYDYTFDAQEIERMIYHNFYDAKTIEDCMRLRICNAMTVEMTKLIDIFDITLTKRRGPRGEEWHARGEAWVIPTKK